MAYLIFALVVAFVAANVVVETVNQGSLKWWRSTLSDYLQHARYAWLLRWAFLGLVAAELLMIVEGRSTVQSVALASSAFGLIGVVLTKFPFTASWPAKLTRDLHLAAAALAFVAGVVFEFAALSGTPSIWFPIGAVLATGTLAIRAPEQEAITEKTLMALVLAGLVPLIGIPM